MGEFVNVQVTDGVATIRLDRPPMNAISVQVQAELRDGRRDGHLDTRDPRGGCLRRREGLRRGRRRQRDGRQALRGNGSGQPGDAHVVHRGRHDPQAGRRGGHRLRARWRAGTGAVCGLSGVRRERQVWAARNFARDHPRCRWHTTAAAADRARPGPRTWSTPGGSSMPTRRCGSGWSTRWCPTAMSTTLPPGWPLSSGPVPRRRCAPPSRRSTPGSAWISMPASRSNGCISRRCSAPRTRSEECAASSKTARARPVSSVDSAVADPLVTRKGCCPWAASVGHKQLDSDHPEPGVHHRLDENH